MAYHSMTRLLDRWLPANLDERLGNRPELKIRARIMVGLYLANVIILAASCLLFALLHLFTHHDLSIALGCTVGAGLLLYAQIAMFYRLGNVGASAIFYSMTFFGSTLAVLIFTGGWASPVRQLFFCAPVISFLVGGRHEGFYIAGLTLVVGLVMLIADHLGFQIFQVIKPENAVIANAVLWDISINLLMACLAVYDAILESYSKSVDLPPRRTLR